MSWECVNPAEIAARLPQDNPIAAREVAETAVAGKLGGVFRDGLHWGDERLWRHVDSAGHSRPFNLSPLLPDDFDVGDPYEMMVQAEGLLRDSQWERGWRLYEMRHQIEQGRDQMPRLFMPHWDGCSCRRLLVHAGQGAGDAIMFARYLMELDKRGIASDFLVPLNLVWLMQKLHYRGRVIDQFDEHLYDAHIPVESLPLALKMYEPIDAGHYLRPGCAAFRRPRPVAAVAWSGQSFHPRNAHRSMTLEQILAHVPPDMDVVSLQVGETREQLQYAPWILDMADGLRDWSDTADALAGVDLLVTVDTGIAHLAGAMGVPVKLVLREPAEWRWGHGSTTPWYRSVSITRINGNFCNHPALRQAGSVGAMPCASCSTDPSMSAHC